MQKIRGDGVKESLLVSAWGNWLDCDTISQDKNYERINNDGEKDHCFLLDYVDLSVCGRMLKIRLYSN